MKKANLLITLLFLFFTGHASAQTSVSQYSVAEVPAAIYEGLEFPMEKIELPKFPALSVDIREYGAVGDGRTKNTEAFAAAMTSLSDQGGGTLLVPRGMWLTGPIQFRSNINLHVAEGALILFSRDFEDYPLIHTSFEGLNTVRCMSPIYAKDVENIAITGRGVIDGNGDAWRPVKKGKMTANQWKNLIASGGVLNPKEDMWFPTEGSLKGFIASSNFNVPDRIDPDRLSEVRDFLRPVMVSIVGSRRILLDGITFQNSPAWNIHPLMSEHVVVRNLQVRNPWYSQNGDGLDIESCQNVFVYDNTFDVGDDAICIKSGKDEDGRRRAIATENVVIKNNIVYHGHGGVVVGSEMSGGVRNMHVSSCTFIGTDIGLRFKSTRGRGGVVEKIYISDIQMINIPTQAIDFNLFYGGKAPVLDGDEPDTPADEDFQLEPVTEETPSFRDIFMKDITVIDSYEAAKFQGLPEMNLQNVRLENALLQTQKGITVLDTEGLELVNVQVIPNHGPALTIHNSKAVQIIGLKAVVPEGPKVRILGSKSESIEFQHSGLSGDNDIWSGKSVSEGTITVAR